MMTYNTGHSVRGSTVFAGMDTVTGELVTVTEWVLKWRHVARKLPPERDEEDSEAKAYLKQVRLYTETLIKASICPAHGYIALYCFKLLQKLLSDFDS